MLFADRAVVPYAIGVDIGCGVALVETDLTVETLAPDELGLVLEAIDAGVPTGFRKLDAPVDREVAVAEIGLERPASVQEAWLDRALDQLGTLGGGNHFLEVQRDEAGRSSSCSTRARGAWASRSATRSTSGRSHWNRRWHSRLPHEELAFLPVGRTTSPATGRRWSSRSGSRR